jgi:hypothetical protein
VLETTSVPGGGNTEIQVAYQTGDGRYSDWSDPYSLVLADVLQASEALAAGDL